MSDPSTNRLVKYTLTMEVSPDAEQNAKRFKDFMKLTQSEVDEAVKNSAEHRVEAEKSSADRITEMQQQQLRVLEDINRQSTMMVDMKIAEQLKAEEEAARAKEEREKDSLRRIEDAYKKHLESVKRSAKELTDGYLAATEGFITMAQGAASVGILAEEDAEKMLRLIVTIRGVADVAKGGIELYRGISAAVDAYRTSVLAATAAEEALNAARAKGGASEFFGPTASGATGSGGLATAIGGLNASVLSLPAAIAAAVGSVAYSGTLAAESFNIGGAADSMAANGWYDPNSYWGQLTAHRNAMSLTGAIRGDGYDALNAQDAAVRSQNRTERMQSERQSRLTQEAGIFSRTNARDQAAFDSQIQSMLMQQQREADIQGMLGGPTADSVLLQLSMAQGRVGDANRNRSEADAVSMGTIGREANIARANKLQVHALQEVINLRKQALVLHQQEGQQALALAKEETQEIERQLELKKTEQERIESQLLSARQRFGQLDESTQQQSIAAFRKAQNGGTLTRDESSLLRGIGTQQAEEFAKTADLARADAAGFSGVFGAAENATVKELIRDSMKLKLQLEDKREVEISLKEDAAKDEALVANIVSQVELLLNERDEKKFQQIKLDLEATLRSRSNAASSGLPNTGSG